MIPVTAILAAIGVLSIPGISAQTCTSLYDIIQAQPDHQIFGWALEASGITFQPDAQYTLIVPSNSGFGGLLSAYGIDTSSKNSIASSPLIKRLAGFMKYYIIPGLYTSSDLTARPDELHLRTLFDPTTDGLNTCSDPNGDSNKPSDGDIQFVVNSDGFVELIDDSANTSPAKLTITNLEVCNGIVHLIEGFINPCCPDFSEATCTAAPFDDRQQDHVDVLGVPPATNPDGSAAPALPLTAAAVLAMGVAMLI